MSLYSSITSKLSEYVIFPFQESPTWKKACIIGGTSFMGITFAVYFFVSHEDRAHQRHNYQNASKDIPEYNAKQLLSCDTMLGECPLWDDRKQLVCWIDEVKQIFWTFNPKTNQSNSYNLPERPGSFCLCSNGSYLFAFVNGPAFYNPLNNTHKNITPINPKNRIFNFEPNILTVMNDGRVDKQGRFVVGGMLKMHYAAKNYFFNLVWKYLLNVIRAFSGVRSAVYRINTDLSHIKIIDDVMMANSICFGLDKKSMFFTDTAKWPIFDKNPRIERYDYYENDDELPDNNEVFTQNSVFADGSIIDSDGYLWNAQCGNGKVIRYDKNGNVDMIVNVPSQNPTCCCFGGENLDIMYITSLQPVVTSKWNSSTPDGGLFSVKIDGVKGNLEDRFKGIPVVN